MYTCTQTYRHCKLMYTHTHPDTYTYEHTHSNCTLIYSDLVCMFTRHTESERESERESESERERERERLLYVCIHTIHIHTHRNCKLTQRVSASSKIGLAMPTSHPLPVIFRSPFLYKEKIKKNYFLFIFLFSLFYFPLYISIRTHWWCCGCGTWIQLRSLSSPLFFLFCIHISLRSLLSSCIRIFLYTLSPSLSLTRAR
jgi:hypothetical protein